LLRRTVGHVKAVNEANFELRVGETLGIVGESGSGKSTIAMALMRLISFEGQAEFDGRSLATLSKRELRNLRQDMQIVFQDPYGSLSPRMTCAQVIAEGLRVHRIGDVSTIEQKVCDIMVEVGLDPAMMHRYPHEFSGGQRQRIAIARAMVLRPKLVILDEPTSALDMTVQVQIVDLLRDLQRSYGLAYIFISHDLKVVRAMSHRVMVMKRGDIIEEGDSEQIFTNPSTEYTKALVDAAMI
jgi:microcin C transport system ATP-binding protein